MGRHFDPGWASFAATVTGALAMPLIDSQAHAHAANTPERPWANLPKALELAKRDTLVI